MTRAIQETSPIIWLTTSLTFPFFLQVQHTRENVGEILYGGVTFAEADGTGVFTDSLIAELYRGVFNVNQIVYDIDADSLGMYANLVGQNLDLEDSGFRRFPGPAIATLGRRGLFGDLGK